MCLPSNTPFRALGYWQLRKAREVCAQHFMVNWFLNKPMTGQGSHVVVHFLSTDFLPSFLSLSRISSGTRPELEQSVKFAVAS